MGGLTLWCTWLWRAFLLQSTAAPKKHGRDLEQGIGPPGAHRISTQSPARPEVPTE